MSKARNSKIVGKSMNHPFYGSVHVDSVVTGSFTKVNITCTQRGPGWDQISQSYKRFKKPTILQSDGSRSLNWGHTNHDQYGKKDVCHVDDLFE